MAFTSTTASNNRLPGTLAQNLTLRASISTTDHATRYHSGRQTRPTARPVSESARPDSCVPVLHPAALQGTHSAAVAYRSHEAIGGWPAARADRSSPAARQDRAQSACRWRSRRSYGRGRVVDRQRVSELVRLELADCVVHRRIALQPRLPCKAHIAAH